MGSYNFPFPPGTAWICAYPQNIDLAQIIIDKSFPASFVFDATGQFDVPDDHFLRLIWCQNYKLFAELANLDTSTIEALDIQDPGGQTLTDEDMAIIGEMGQLKLLQLRSRNVTDKGLSTLTRLTNLQHLELRCSQIKTTALGGSGIMPLKYLVQCRPFSFTAVLWSARILKH